MRGPSPSPSAWGLAVTAALVATLACIWTPAAPPLMDLPIQLLASAVHADPEAFTTWWELGVAITGQGFVWIAVPFIGLGPVLAAKLGLSLVALLAVAGFTMSGRAWGERHPPAAILAGPCLVGFPLAMGFDNFIVAVIAAVATAGLAARAVHRPSRSSWLVLAAAGLATSVLHVVVGLMVAPQVVMTAGLAGAGDARVRVRRAAVALATCVPGLAYSTMALWRVVLDYDDAGTRSATEAIRLDAPTQALNVVAKAFGGYSDVGALAALAILVCLAGLPRDRRRIAVATAVAWLASYLVLPYHTLGWAFAQPRPLALGWALLATFGCWGSRPNLRLAIVGAASCLYLASWGYGAVGPGERLGVAIDELDGTRPGFTTVAPLDAGRSPYDDEVESLRHAGAFAMLGGGGSLGLFTYSPMTLAIRPVVPEGGAGLNLPQNLHVLLDCDAADRARCALDAATAVDRVAAAALTKETVVLVGLSDSIRGPLATRGLRAIDGAPSLVDARVATVVELDPGFIDVLVGGAAAALDGHDVVLRAGIPETIGWVASVARRAGDSLPATIRFGPMPCGPMTIELSVDDRAVIARSVDVRCGEVVVLALGGPEPSAPR